MGPSMSILRFAEIRLGTYLGSKRLRGRWARSMAPTSPSGLSIFGSVSASPAAAAAQARPARARPIRSGAEALARYLGVKDHVPEPKFFPRQRGPCTRT